MEGPSIVGDHGSNAARPRSPEGGTQSTSVQLQAQQLSHNAGLPATMRTGGRTSGPSAKSARGAHQPIALDVSVATDSWQALLRRRLISIVTSELPADGSAGAAIRVVSLCSSTVKLLATSVRPVSSACVVSSFSSASVLV